MVYENTYYIIILNSQGVLYKNTYLNNQYFV